MRTIYIVSDPNFVGDRSNLMGIAMECKREFAIKGESLTSKSLIAQSIVEHLTK